MIQWMNRIRASCTVDLLSTALRPYSFLVTCWSSDPYPKRQYEIVALSDDDAANEGLVRYEREMLLRAMH